MKCSRRVKKLILNFILIILLIKFLRLFATNLSNESESSEYIQDLKSNDTFILISKCKCKKNISLKRTNQNDSIRFEISTPFKSYNINNNEFNRLQFSCNYYNFFARSSGLKVISYSLYGRLDRYYKWLEILAVIINRYYPGWIMRIYHDDSIDKSIICKLECLPFNNVDFCDITNMPLIINNSGLFEYKQDMSYLHAMMWRWLPLLLGDIFVDIFMSRDTDSLIIQREIESVHVWLNESNKTGHIMRDHLLHKREILGGMWGFHLNRNRKLADQIFRIYKNKSLTQAYGDSVEDVEKNKYDADQKFLADYVYDLIKNDSIIHDSYHCDIFENTLPFPNKRNNIVCHVGFVGDCMLSNEILYECPINCRPFKHKEWNFC